MIFIKTATTLSIDFQVARHSSAPVGTFFCPVISIRLRRGITGWSLPRVLSSGEPNVRGDRPTLLYKPLTLQLKGVSYGYLDANDSNR